MKLIVRLIISTIAVLVTDLLLSGVHANDFMTGLLVAVVLGLLNSFVRPLLVLFTLPATILTLGLFLLVINAAMVLLAAKLVPGFVVESFWWALGFSLLMGVVQGFLNALDGGQNAQQQQ
jgi:putative membrane protein